MSDDISDYINKIYHSLGQAWTYPKNRRKHVLEAKAAACTVAMRLKSDVKDVVNKLLFKIHVGQQRSPTLNDLSRKGIVAENSLMHFQNSDTLTAFLKSCIPALVATEKLSEGQADEFIGRVRSEYDAFMKLPLNGQKLEEDVKLLEWYFCKRRSKSAALGGADRRSKCAAPALLVRIRKADLRLPIVSSLTIRERSPCCETCITGPKSVVLS